MKLIPYVIILVLGFVTFQNVFGEEQVNDEIISIMLEARTQQAYKNSAYSFRYKTRDSFIHKNYVDIVYQHGIIVIKPHGGIEAEIVEEGIFPFINTSKKQITPKTGYETRS